MPLIVGKPDEDNAGEDNATSSQFEINNQSTV